MDLRETKRTLLNLDYWLITAVCVICVLGIISISSATKVNLGESSSTYISQIIWFAVGIVIMIITTLINYQYFSKYYLIFYGINILMLLAVLLIGRNVNGATRWIYIGGVGIQPSEFSKLIMIFCLAKIIDKNRENIDNIVILLTIIGFGLVPVVLVTLQPSLSASLVLVAILAIQIFVGGVNYKYVSFVLIVGIVGLSFVLWDVQNENYVLVDKFLSPYQISRIETFINPIPGSDEYYQTTKSINAIGSGELMGKGLYEGTLNQLSYLPEPHNDFIFSVIGEEFGFIGCIIILILEFFIVFRCLFIAMTSRNLFSQLIAAGVGGMIAFQVLVNTGVATGLLPNTGMSLPFVSYGGSSMWANMASIGLVLNIGSKRSKSIFEEE